MSDEHDPVHKERSSSSRRSASDAFGRGAERVARFFGTPQYIVGQTLIVIVWIVFNGFEIFVHFDKYPFILLNLAFSTQAAYAAPLILLAQTRQAERDKVQAEHGRKAPRAACRARATPSATDEEGIALLKGLIEENTELTEEVQQAHRGDPPQGGLLGRLGARSSRSSARARLMIRSRSPQRRSARAARCSSQSSAIRCSSSWCSAASTASWPRDSCCMTSARRSRQLFDLDANVVKSSHRFLQTSGLIALFLSAEGPTKNIAITTTPTTAAAIAIADERGRYA